MRVSPWNPTTCILCGLNANLVCRSEMCCMHEARWKCRTQNFAIWAPSHNLVGLYLRSSQLAYIDNRKKLVKQQYLLHMSTQYDELAPTSGWEQFTSLWHPSKFQRVLRVGFVTALTSLNGRQPNCTMFCRLLGWHTTGIIIYSFRGSCPLREFCQVQNSFPVQVLCSPI